MPIIPETNHRTLFTGSKINAQYIQALLLEEEIKSVIRDDGESARRAGFGMDYMNEAKLLVAKDDYLKAKHIVDKLLDEHGNLIGVDEELLAEQAMQTRTLQPQSRKKEETAYRRSTGNLLLNAAIVLYSGYRLYPLLEGESLPAWRIFLSGALLLFCGGTLLMHFMSSTKAST